MADSEGTKVGSIFYDSKIDSSGAKQGADEIEGLIGRLKGQFNSLNPTVRALGVSLGAYLGGKALLNFFEGSIEAANESNRVMAQTEAVITSTGSAAGYTSGEISKMATEIQKTTAISDEAAQSGMNMLLTFTNIGHDVFPEATQAMIDMATAMNGGLTPSAEDLRGTAIQLGKALQDPVTGMQALHRVGVNFTKDQEAMVEGLVNSNKGMEAQKFILGELAREFGGSAAAQAQTFEGQVEQVGNQLNDMKENIGKALIPALSYLIGAVSGASGGFNLFVGVIQTVSSAIIGLIAVARMLGMVLNGVFATGIALLSGQANLIGDIWKDTFADIYTEGATATQKLTGVWNQETGKQVGISNAGANQEIAASGRKSSKVKKDLEDETEKYTEETAKRNRRFQENMTDLIFAHQDKVKSLKKDMDEETATFNERINEQVKNFKESMAEMEADHAKKVKELQGDLQDETKTHEERTATIQALIDQELSYGKNARQSKIDMWKGELAEELDSYNEKTAQIQEKINEEDITFSEASAKNIARNEEETTKLTEEHNKRVADTQAQLDAEQAILNAHQDVVNQVKDKARQDDITRLQAQHAEENAEAEQQHIKRMGDIVRQGNAEGGASGASFNAGIAPELQKLKDMASSTTKDMARDMVTNIATGAKEAGERMVKDFFNATVDKAKDAKNFAGGALMAVPGLNAALSVWAQLPKLASGAHNFEGGLALVGEEGPEIVHLPKGADVYSHDQSTGGLAQNIYVTVERMESGTDIDSLVREIGFRINQLPR